jgi:hypothetical protein
MLELFVIKKKEARSYMLEQSGGGGMCMGMGMGMGMGRRDEAKETSTELQNFDGIAAPFV